MTALPNETEWSWDVRLPATRQSWQRAETQVVVAATSDPRAGLRFREALVDAWVDEAVRHAWKRELEPGLWIATVAGVTGAMADGDSEQEVTRRLPTVLHDWAWLKIDDGDRDIPVIGGVDLNRF